jgi:hypothetical protein
VVINLIVLRFYSAYLSFLAHDYTIVDADSSHTPVKASMSEAAHGLSRSKDTQNH